MSAVERGRLNNPAVPVPVQGRPTIGGYKGGVLQLLVDWLFYLFLLCRQTRHDAHAHEPLPGGQFRSAPALLRHKDGLQRFGRTTTMSCSELIGPSFGIVHL